MSSEICHLFSGFFHDKCHEVILFCHHACERRNGDEQDKLYCIHIRYLPFPLGVSPLVYAFLNKPLCLECLHDVALRLIPQLTNLYLNPHIEELPDGLDILCVDGNRL